MNKSKTSSVNINLGISTILLIFFVLSMVSFAVLSLSSAVSDKKLTDKAVNKTLNYYDVNNLMQDKLLEYDDICYNAYINSSDKASYLSMLNEEETFVIEANDTQDLVVTVVPNYPTSNDDCLFTITSWKLVQTREPDIDYSIPVYH